MLGLARRQGLTLVERAFSVAEAQGAREAFITSTSYLVMPVTQIDDRVVANGRPGTLSRMLRAEGVELP